MNHGKVRIYDLSKELKIDNKEVLDICERLNIGVKSHSSTITESQAERIKATAERMSSQNSSAKNRFLKEEDDDLENDNNKNKQKILAVHHKQSSDDISDSMQEAESDYTQQLAPPPRVPKSVPNSKSNSFKSDSETPSKSTSSESIDGSLTLTENNTKVTISGDLEDTTISQEKTEMSEKPILIGPPVRPEKPKPQVKDAKQSNGKSKTSGKRSKQSEQNNLEQNNLEQNNLEQNNSTETSTVKETPKLTEKPKAKAKGRPKFKPEAAPEKTEEENNQKELPKLQKPQLPKPVKPKSEEKLIENEDLEIDSNIGDSEDLQEKSADVEEVILLEKPKRKSVKLNKLDKSRQWQDDEDDESKAKNAKGVNKNKRKSIVIDEDEEDLDDLLNAAANTTVMSRAIARPPRPKSETAGVTAKSTPATKPKKPQHKSDSKQEKRNDSKSTQTNTVEERPEIVTISGSLTVRELSDLLKVPETEIIKNLFFKGIAVNITQTLEEDTAKQVAEDLGVLVDTPKVKAAAAKTTDMIDVEDLEKLVRRPPVVTIMGHVDHGKTTLLDSIRETKVAQGEAGGITQHIGAYHVDLEYEGKTQQVVFLDTPGHEAFTAMRARGTKVTDIAVLVVAADDGVQPQTREAISHAKAAGVPIVVAINKIDKLDANPERIKQELMELDLVPEEYGGDTMMVPVSALKGENLDTLLDSILLQSEVEELSANPERLAKGTIIEAHLDRAKGAVATLLVQNGTLKVGDIIVAGSVFGRIRAMIDDRGKKVESATPSFAVEILGLNEVPEAGDEFEVFENEKEARLKAEKYKESQHQNRLQQSMSSRRVSLTSFSEQAREGQLKELNLILKGDVQGSVEAIMGSLQQLPQNEVQIRVLLASAGEITETDVDLAAASGAVIIGFNTTLASGARAAADREAVDVREYNIIYKLLDDIQGAMEGLLDPEEVEEYLGTVEVRAVFTVGKGAVAGCYVKSGKVIRNRPMRVMRNNELIFEGTVESLKRVKDDVREVKSGYECGIGCAKFNDWQEGDIIEVYQMVMKRRTLTTA